MKNEFYVHGMHCPACEILIEDKLKMVHGVTNIKADLKTSKVYLESKENVSAESLSKYVEQFGYKISKTKEHQVVNKTNLLKGFTIAVAIFAVFFLLQNLGIADFINPKSITLPFVFLIGVVASLSTCMAVVGGLVLSLSSNYVKEKNYIPLITFHLSRLIGFFILGGIIGLIGSAFTLNTISYFIMDTILFIVMVIMGLNLLELFSFTKKFNLKLPNTLWNKTSLLKQKTGIIPAVILGISTFILPCGFTQSMQIYSLSTGNFLNGALTMLVFALGTLPVLSLISFASVKFQSKLFFSTAGFLVLFFAIFNFYSGLSSLGIFNF